MLANDEICTLERVWENEWLMSKQREQGQTCIKSWSRMKVWGDEELVDKTQIFDKDTNGLSVSEDQGPSWHTHCQNPKISWGRFWWQQ